MIKLLQDIFKTQSSLSCVLAPDHDPRRFCPLKEKLRKNVSSALLWFLLLQACRTSLVIESKAGQELEGAHFCCQTKLHPHPEHVLPKQHRVSIPIWLLCRNTTYGRTGCVSS